VGIGEVALPPVFGCWIFEVGIPGWAGFHERPVVLAKEKSSPSGGTRNAHENVLESTGYATRAHCFKIDSRLTLVVSKGPSINKGKVDVVLEMPQNKGGGDVDTAWKDTQT